MTQSVFIITSNSPETIHGAFSSFVQAQDVVENVLVPKFEQRQIVFKRAAERGVWVANLLGRQHIIQIFEMDLNTTDEQRLHP